LLGFIISNWGIKANPVKITAITDMEALATIKDGSLKLDGGGAGVLFISPKGEQLMYSSRSFGSYPITKPSMKPCFTGCVWRYH
jgi:hypothetical protein